MRRRQPTEDEATRLEQLIQLGRDERDLFDRADAGEISHEDAWAEVFELRRAAGMTVDEMVDVVEAECALDPMRDPREDEHAAP